MNVSYWIVSIFLRHYYWKREKVCVAEIIVLWFRGIFVDGEMFGWWSNHRSILSFNNKKTRTLDQLQSTQTSRKTIQCLIMNRNGIKCRSKTVNIYFAVLPSLTGFLLFVNWCLELMYQRIIPNRRDIITILWLFSYQEMEEKWPGSISWSFRIFLALKFSIELPEYYT
jgi:hypothetical protein